MGRVLTWSFGTLGEKFDNSVVVDVMTDKISTDCFSTAWSRFAVAVSEIPKDALAARFCFFFCFVVNGWLGATSMVVDIEFDSGWGASPSSGGRVSLTEIEGTFASDDGSEGWIGIGCPPSSAGGPLIREHRFDVTNGVENQFASCASSAFSTNLNKVNSNWETWEEKPTHPSVNYNFLVWLGTFDFNAVGERDCHGKANRATAAFIKVSALQRQNKVRGDADGIRKDVEEFCAAT